VWPGKLYRERQRFRETTLKIPGDEIRRRDTTSGSPDWERAAHATKYAAVPAASSRLDIRAATTITVTS
jgi:hypothetical protein